MGMESISTLGMQLVDKFFLEQDRILVDKLRELERVKQTKDELSRMSGLHNDAILEKLVALGVKPAMLAAIEVLPLVEVAWADGAVDEREKSAVLRAAEQMEIRSDSIEHTLLAQWLTHRPDASLMDAWTHYVNGLCDSMSESETTAFKAELLGHAESIAKASGGFLGIGNKVSASERKVLDDLDKAFCPGK